MASVVKQTCRT